MPQLLKKKSAKQTNKQKPTSNIILKNLEAFYLKWGPKQGCLFLAFFISIILVVLPNRIKQEKEIKVCKLGS